MPRQLYYDIPKGDTAANAPPYDLTSRGEVPGPSGTNGYVANGAVCAQLRSQDPTNNGTGSCTYDARSDALRSTYYTQSASGQTE